ncbi:MAG: hypothetical protein LBC20_07765 [Planctomycetaceae bacterium]|jgi:hypothetical protein|nr:hypothetical protein [Planctomycetaceae bacterium]
MKITEQTIQYCIDTLAADVAQRVARENGIILTEALRQFMGTKTYELLLDEKTYLYLESKEYVLDMLKAEQSQDWERWLKI